MAIYKHTYHRYSAALTPAWSRFLAVYRYSRGSIFRSKFQTAFFVLCFFYPVVCLLAVYLTHNLSFLDRLHIQGGQVTTIDHRFFYYFVDVQGTLAFVLTAFAGPGLISPDLANGALPLYFSRPFSRHEYVLGKMSVLAVLLSQVTWIPGLLLFAVQAGLEGSRWLSANLWIAAGILFSCWIWIAILSLLATALSAWVRWKIVAGALLLGIFFIGAGFAQAINTVMRTKLGYLIDIVNLMATVRIGLFRMDMERPLSVPEAWTALLVVCGASLLLIMRKVRAYEVIK